MTEKEEQEKFVRLLSALDNLDGVVIDYSIIKDCIYPLQKYIRNELYMDGVIDKS